MSKVNVAVTGFSGTGSSAVIDLLKEFDNVKEVNFGQPAYEHICLYTPGGLFDLQYKLLQGNDPHRSDEAIREFYRTMRWLNENEFGWFGSYKKYTGGVFMDAVNTFVDQIAQPVPDNIWYWRYKGVRFSLYKIALQLASKLMLRRKIYKWGRRYCFDKGDGFFSYPTEREFCDASKKFISDYFSLDKTSADVSIYDHLIWPQQIENTNSLFPRDFKIIVVRRDPRDIFLLNKYFWSGYGAVATGRRYRYENVSDFCSYWGRLNAKKIQPANNVLEIYFEDLIYNYDKTIKLITDFVDLDLSAHSAQFSCFDPEKSIKNTQIFNVNREWIREADFIAKRLETYLYAFPYAYALKDRKVY